MGKFNENPKIATIRWAVAHSEFEYLYLREFIGIGIINEVKRVLPKDQEDTKL